MDPYWWLDFCGGCQFRLPWFSKNKVLFIVYPCFGVGLKPNIYLKVYMTREISRVSHLTNKVIHFKLYFGWIICRVWWFISAPHFLTVSRLSLKNKDGHTSPIHHRWGQSRSILRTFKVLQSSSRRWPWGISNQSWLVLLACPLDAKSNLFSVGWSSAFVKSTVWFLCKS